MRLGVYLLVLALIILINTNPSLAQSDFSPHAIWVSDSTNSSSEVAFFRKKLVVDKEYQQVRLKIFADTRYEVWLDGKWIGRGPARFTTTYHEYDVYTLSSFSKGPHIISVLVQWAPNTRRSESTRPYLQCLLEGFISQWELIDSTDSTWKAFSSPAWERNASLVHRWGLIGPTELLNLNRLPLDWFSPNYNDQSWPQAQIVDINERWVYSLAATQFLYQDGYSEVLFAPLREKSESTSPVYSSRSIRLMTEVSIDYLVVDRGFVSADMYIVEMVPDTQMYNQMSFSVLQSNHVRFERLKETKYESAPNIKIDNVPLTWLPKGEEYPDVEYSSIFLSQGGHIISAYGVPATGYAIAISKDKVSIDSIQLDQARHAGRRTLLAAYKSQDSAVKVDLTSRQIHFTSQDPSYVVIDLGRVIHGRIKAKIQGPKNTVIDVGWDERLYKDTKRPLPYPGNLHPEWNQVDSWILDGTERELTTLDTRAGRYVLIVCWGGPVLISNLQFLEERYPVEQKGSFVSSNERLNQIWQVGVNTMYPNMTDAYTDTPWRERGQWLGDQFVGFQANKVVFGDWELFKRMVALMKYSGIYGMIPNGSGLNMLDYQMLWIHELADYARYHPEDKEFVTNFYPTLLAQLSTLKAYENERGLITIPKGHWSQTSYIDSYASSDRYGTSTAINSLYYATLRKASEIAYFLNDDQRGKEFFEKAESIKISINQTHFLPIYNCYAGTEISNEFTNPTVYAQSYALYYDIVDDDKVDEVIICMLSKINKDPLRPNVGPYGMYWVLGALGKHDRVYEGIYLIQLFYYYMIKNGATSWWEGFDSNKYYWSSLSHMWGSAPTVFLNRYILGLQLLGKNEWLWKPALSAVGWAKGSLAIPEDPYSFDVEWVGTFCQASMKLNSPINSKGTVVLKPVIQGNIFLNGQLIWRDGESMVNGVYYDNNTLRISLQGGNHTLQLEQGCRHLYLPLMFR